MHNLFPNLVSANLIIYDPNFHKSEHSTNFSQQEVVEFEILSSRSAIRPIASFLKLHSSIRANNAIDLTVIDTISSRQRFNANYQLQSLVTNTR